MRKIILIICTLLLLSACASTKQANLMTGYFEGRPHWSGDPNTSLSIKQNGTFELFWNNHLYRGVWEISDKDQVLLKFDEITDIVLLLSSGVISDKERNIHFHTRNKVRMDNITLRRVK